MANAWIACLSEKLGCFRSLVISLQHRGDEPLRSVTSFSNMMHARLFVLFFAIMILTGLRAQEVQITDPLKLLALGDSYTFGEGVAVEDRWPDQLADTLVSLGYTLEEINVVAMTGWTTGNLLDALNADPPDEDFSLVSLLIGVNNQFSGGSIVNYEFQFEQLLVKAIQYAGGDPSRVFVMSIPDYRYTPFGETMNGVSIEIDEFNSVNEAITDDFGVTYVYITDITRRGLDEPELVAGDGLHPSPLMYALWVRRILENADLQISSSATHVGNNPDVLIYPNPVDNWLHVVVPSETDYTITRYDGAVIETPRSRTSGPVDVSTLPPGIYVLTLTGEWGTQYRRFAKIGGH
jgi:lysophospholipase L1-like esterase